MDEEAFERYKQYRLQGLSSSEAYRRAMAPPEVETLEPAPARARGVSARTTAAPRGIAQEFARGTALGATQAATSLAQGIGFLGRQAGRLIPGEDALERGGRRLEQAAGRAEQRAEEYFDPRGTAGTVGRFGGRLAGEVAATVGTLGAGRIASARYAPRALKAVEAATKGSRLRSAAGAAAAEAPLSFVRAAGEAAEGGDFGRELAIELGGAAIGGALIGGGAAREAAEEAGRFGKVPVAIGARAERKLPKQQQFMSLRDVIRNKFIQDTIAPLALIERQGGKAAREQADNLVAQVAGSNRQGMMWMQENLQPFFRKPGQKIGTFFDNLLGKQKVGGLDDSFGDIRDEVSRFALVRREYTSRQKKNAPKLAIDDEELKRLYEEGMSDPRLVAATDKLQDYFRSLLEIREGSGIITSEAADAIRRSDDYYTPFLAEYYANAEQARLGTKGGPLTIGDTGVAKMDRELPSEALRVDPFEVAVVETQRTFRDAARQEFQNFFQEFIPEEGIPGLIRVLRPGTAKQEGAQTFRAIRNGKQVTFEVLNKDLYEGIAQNTQLPQNIFARTARALADIKRTGITILPDFAVMSLIRDAAGYAIQTTGENFRKEVVRGALAGGAVGAAAGGEEGALYGAVAGAAGVPMVRPSLEILSAIKSVAMNDDAFRRFARSGAITQGFNVRDLKSARRVLRELGDDANTILKFDSFGDVLGAIKSAVARPGEIAEMAPRLAAFNKAKSMGMDDLAAAKFAQDITLRFGNRGSLTKGVSSITPFFNAKLQGWDKLAKMIADPKTSAAGVAMITAPTIALWSVNKDNPEYWDRPLWERNLFWLIPKEDGGFYRIPKPFEIGYLFASLPERMMDYAARSGDEGAIPDFIQNLIGETAAPSVGEPGRELLQSARSVIQSPISEAVPIPTALEIPLQQWANRSFFTGRQIVPEFARQKPAEFQYRPSTPGVARLASQIPEEVEIIPGAEYLRSPLRVEQLITDVFGTSGRRAMDIADIGLRAAGEPAAETTRTPTTAISALGQISGLSRFGTREYDVSQVEYEAQQKIDRLNEINNRLTQLRNERVPAEQIRQFVEENRSALLARRALERPRLALSRIERQRTQIMRRQDISIERKRELLELLKKRGDALSRRVLEYEIK